MVLILVGCLSQAKSSEGKTLRHSFIPQMTIGATAISEIEFDIYSRHELVPILMALQHLYVNRRSCIEEICSLIKDDVIKDQNEKLGDLGRLGGRPLLIGLTILSILSA